MDDNALPVAYLNWDDAILLAPVLASYGAWIRRICPFPSVIQTKAAAIESLQAKLFTLQQARPAMIEGALFAVTVSEVDTLTTALEYFVAYLPRMVAPSQERDGILESCNRLRAYIAATFS